jgi:hypothetical protein
MRAGADEYVVKTGDLGVGAEVCYAVERHAPRDPSRAVEPNIRCCWARSKRATDTQFALLEPWHAMRCGDLKQLAVTVDRPHEYVRGHFSAMYKQFGVRGATGLALALGLWLRRDTPPRGIRCRK